MRMGGLIMRLKGGLRGNAPNKLRSMLKARGVSLQVTHALGTAKSLFCILSPLLKYYNPNAL